MLRTGVDIIEIERVASAVAEHGQRFLSRVYTADELAYCRQDAQRLAVRFAAKEAIAKALGTGIWRNGITWTDIEIVRDDESGAPSVRLHNAAKQQAHTLTLNEWSISLSHSQAYAVAFVVATTRCNDAIEQ
ncbi:MAG: holo-ACP synthase [Caldilineaceae bacterium]|nr:holo-ACP synthase [Caldilineaceae bacterium]